ncbi:MLX-interacting protein-like [Tigriopus californicus]|uniref:MLX-interacting protein-like n=1 Tax=Tigriopus californicus TaxID=6832 RepID=UPI0027DA6B0C|nr:MLX-interacting protein-like [Tigriopus californicus]|eukprot:TCALIF_03196-PA protein Name:"Similar to Mlxip MLX-interacting protein (Mus musculus)" AED:0.29 eAED:0.30 QI:0/-1/0/1/-1/1/1/0/862
MAVVRHKEAIHSGHFMISDFEAEAEAEEDISVPQAEEGSNMPQLVSPEDVGDIPQVPTSLPEPTIPESVFKGQRREQAQSIIDISLNKLFQSMSIAYRQKLTSPKWNKFRGMKLRWKDKIRLNNVIWRCWHMQFMKGRNQLLCPFANPLEIDNHNRTEGSTLLEGKYWKRQLQTVTTEYKRWRLFYKNRGSEHEEVAGDEWDQLFQHPFQLLEGSKDDASLITDDEYFVDALFNSIAQDPHTRTLVGQTLAVPFPNPREMHKNTTNADFIQPGLVQLQPNLEDLFELESLNQLPDWLTNRLPSIQEATMDEQSLQQPSINGAIPKSMGGPEMSANSSGTIYTTLNISDVAPPNSSLLSSSEVMTSLQSNNMEMNDTNKMTMTSPLLLNPSQHEQFQPESFPASGNHSVPTSKYNLIPCSSPGSSCYAGPIPHPKRNSPKHRILCQRDFVNECNFASNAASTLTRKVSGSSITHQSSGLHQTDSPYHLPSIPSTISDPSMYSHSEGARGGIKTRSLSGGSAMGRSTAWKTSSSSPPMGANSELIQLLRSNTKGSTQDSFEHQVGTKVKLEHEPTKPTHFKPLIIPPPPPQSQPQPSFTIGIGGPMDSSSSTSSTSTNRGSVANISENRRLSNAEQKRRGSIKDGFDILKGLIPSLNQTNRVKISKAALLHKGGDHIQHMKSERAVLKEEIDSLRAQVDSLNQDILRFQASLPTASIDVEKSGSESLMAMDTLFHEHVKKCTQLNWKYWVFSLLMRPLLKSFHQSVKVDSFKDMARTTMSWLDQECSLAHLRPTVLTALKDLSTETDILNNPGRIPEEAVFAVQRPKSKTLKVEPILLAIQNESNDSVRDMETLDRDPLLSDDS